MNARIVLAAVTLALAGCGGTPVEPLYLDAATMQAEWRAAVGRPGTTVCRELKVGTVERDWLRGTVLEVRGEALVVRIDQPGRFTHVVDGVSVAKDAVVLSDPMAWEPCR